MVLVYKRTPSGCFKRALALCVPNKTIYLGPESAFSPIVPLASRVSVGPMLSVLRICLLFGFAACASAGLANDVVAAFEKAADCPSCHALLELLQLLAHLGDTILPVTLIAVCTTLKVRDYSRYRRVPPLICCSARRPGRLPGTYFPTGSYYGSCIEVHINLRRYSNEVVQCFIWPLPASSRPAIHRTVP